MSWNTGGNKNLLLKNKSNLGVYHVLLTTSRISRKKHAVEMQQLPALKRMIQKKKFPTQNGQNIMLGEKYMWTSSIIETIWKLLFTVNETNSESKTMTWMWHWQIIRCSWQSEYFFWVTLTYFANSVLYWIKQLFIAEMIFIKNGGSVSIAHFPILL